MKKYKIIANYRTAYWEIYRRKFIFFGLIPTGWEFEFRHFDREDLANWIDRNVKEQDERIHLKLNL